MIIFRKERNLELTSCQAPCLQTIKHLLEPLMIYPFLETSEIGGWIFGCRLLVHFRGLPDFLFCLCANGIVGYGEPRIERASRISLTNLHNSFARTPPAVLA